METANLGLKGYVRGSEERMKIATQRFENIEDGEITYEYKRRKANERKTQGTQKQYLHNLLNRQ